MLKLVQWAVGSRPQRIDVMTDQQGLVLTHNGDPPLADEIRGLLPRALSSLDGPVRELAMGVNGALRVARDEILLDSGQGWRLRVGPQGESFEPTGGTGAVRLRVPRSNSFFGFLLGTPETRALHAACNFCPVPLFVNGSMVQRQLGSPPHDPSSDKIINYYEPGWRWWKLEGWSRNTRRYGVPVDHNVVELRLPGTELGLLPTRASLVMTAPNEAPVLPVAPTPEGHLRQIFERRIRPRYLEQAYGFLGLPALPPAAYRFAALRGKIALVHRGVVVGHLPHPFAVGAWAVPSGTTDLSGLKLQDETVQQLGAVIKAAALAFRQTLARLYPGPDLRAILQKAWLDAHARRGGDPERKHRHG